MSHQATNPLEAPDLPFRVRSEETVREGRAVHLVLAQVEGPDGTELTREVVHHPGAVGVLPLHDDGTVTLVYQYRVALDRGLWEIPAGLRDVDGEPPEVTAGRELKEEAGLAAASITWLVTFHNSPGFSDESVEVYLATGLTAVPDDRQGPEEQHMVADRIPLGRALELVRTGQITDSKTVIALLWAERERLSS